LNRNAVIPANAGIQHFNRPVKSRIPAFAGMTGNEHAP